MDDHRTLRPCPDTSRWQDMQRLSRRDRAMAEAQVASEIGGHEDRNVPSLADWMGASAIFTCIFGVGVVAHALLKSAGWL